jgi:hypothetical protein
MRRQMFMTIHALQQRNALDVMSIETIQWTSPVTEHDGDLPHALRHIRLWG